MQLRGGRPFFSNKFDITKHRQYRLLSDYDEKNAFDIEKYVKNLCKTRVRDNDTVGEVEDAGVIEAWQLNMEKLNMEPVSKQQNFWTKSPEVKKRSFECTWERTKTKHPAQPIAKLNVPDARRVLPKGFPCLYLTIRQGILHEKTLSETRQNYF